MNEKQQQLTFDKGMTNIPSDAICSDNELEECLNLYYADGEHHPIQSPVEFMNGLTGKVLFVHKLASGEHFIYRTPIADNDQTVYSLKWRTKDDATEHDIVNDYGTEKDVQITAIGKTLIVNIPGKEIKYFLWKANDGEYSSFNNLPEPEVIFEIGKLTDNRLVSAYERSKLEISDEWVTLREDQQHSKTYIEINENYETEYNDATVGLYRKNLESIRRDKGFSRPFFVRYALEMYDGSYTKISAPILMLPSITHNNYAFIRNFRKNLYISTLRAGLYYKAKYDYTEWKDIIKGLVVFVSDGIEVQDASGHVEGGIETVPTSSLLPKLPQIFQREYRMSQAAWVNGQMNDAASYVPFPLREEREIIEDLKAVSVFYKIFELGTSVDTDGEFLKASSLIRDNVLVNLTSQEQLTDDYYSHNTMSADFTTTYNNRLLLAGVRRGFFKGFTSFMPYNKNTSHSITTENVYIRVWIKTDEGDRIIGKMFETDDIIGRYFFYPDPRAYKAEIYKVYEGIVPLMYLIKEIDLKEHPFLNGAIYLEGLPDGTENMEAISSDMYPVPDDVDTPEYLYNQVFNSEVNNPFVFRAEGNITVGNGKIMALASLTQALSQGQFGQYPLIIFTDEGIFAASIDNTGVVKAVHPMSREVLNNVRSVTQTDGAVFFSSAKGLMVVVGNEVKCVSEQMNGICSGVISGSFQSYLKNAFIAYDYRDSLLWILNGSSICYLYSIRSGTFSHYHFPAPINNVVNYYPDFLLQDTGQQTSKLYSLMERTPIADDIISTYEGFFTTRPMKFENALALKSIMQIIHIKQIESGTVTMRIFASNNLDKDSTTWVELHSLRGEPWKYYKFRFDFANWKATDTFAGSVVVTQERRIEKLR